MSTDAHEATARYEAMQTITGLYGHVDKALVDEVMDKVIVALATANVPNHGKLWSLLRSTLEQGGMIQLDYQAGEYKSYEEYSARMDAAARERADQWARAVLPREKEGT